MNEDGVSAGPLPEGMVLVPAGDLRTRANGRVMIGGAPLTFLRLHPAGAATVRTWFSGVPVGGTEGQQALARRLIRTGMAHPRAGGSGTVTAAELTVVIPVKDDEHGLAVTLAGLRGNGEKPVPVIVVDDGSERPVAVRRVADRHSAVTVLRNHRPTGPGAARQRALRQVETKLVACIDAGVLISYHDLLRLADGLADRGVVAVAPRVASGQQNHLVGRYDARRSPLDLGPVESLVGPGRSVPYVPTACVVLRRSAVAAVGGFDPLLRYGEDVDLVWRLGGIGHVRYLPSVIASHPPRPTVRTMMAQRWSYGSAAAPLAARHGSVVAPCTLSPWSLLVGGLGALGRPLAALAVTVGTGLALRPKISPLPDVTVEALQLTAKGHWYGARSLLTALARTWAPLAVGAMAVFPSQRGRLGRLLTAAFLRRLLDGPRRPGPAAVDLCLGAVDDLSYCAGVWSGILRNRSAKALLPALGSWPTKSATDPPPTKSAIGR